LDDSCSCNTQAVLVLVAYNGSAWLILVAVRVGIGIFIELEEAFELGLVRACRPSGFMDMTPAIVSFLRKASAKGVALPWRFKNRL